MIESSVTESESSPVLPSLIEIADQGDLNELALHLRESGLMFDPAHADLVRRACRGRGEHSQLLLAIVGDFDEIDDGPAPAIMSSSPVSPPQAAPAFRTYSMTPRQKMKGNPFLLPKSVTVKRSETGEKPHLRSAVLTDEAGRLYRCLAFAMLEYGVVMNGHMTVTWEQWGIRDNAQAVAVLTEFNARMGKWLKVRATGRRRKGTTSTAWGEGEAYYYAFIHEHASNRGFHSHQVFYVSDGKARAFAEYAVTVLRRLTGVTTVPAGGVVFTPNTVRDGFAPYMPRFKKNELERCWIWFRYLTKNLSPHEFTQVRDQYALQRDIFRIRRVFLPPKPVTCTDLFGCSENIAIGAQEKAGFLSKFDSGEWTKLYSGYELGEYRLRLQQQERDNELAGIFDRVKI